MIQSSLTYIHITLHIYYVTLYQNIHTFTYTNILCYILQTTLTYIRIIKVKYNILVINTREKVLNNRIRLYFQRK